MGTLALPGSQLFSELPSAQSPVPVHPPLTRASSNINNIRQPQSSPSTIGTLNSGQHRVNAPHGKTPTAATPNTTPAAPTRKKASAASKRTSQNRSNTPSSSSSQSRPTIQLPGGPLPSNFLRNQQALLGLAGLVSGINPANLSLPKHARGSSPNNPIVIDDEERPALSRIPVPNPGELPAPSNEEIVRTLIKQKNIFPVVEALLRLISGQVPPPPPPEPTAFQRRAQPPEDPPPTKRRKLSQVPAGAADWDVPYPFALGQGPADYRTNWERERGKQLLEDLVTLVKSAARKAAVKNYFKDTHLQQARGGSNAGGKSQGHSTNGNDGLGHYRGEVLRDAVASSNATPGPSLSGSLSVESPSTSPSTPGPSGCPSPFVPDLSSYNWDAEPFNDLFSSISSPSPSTSMSGFSLDPRTYSSTSGTSTPGSAMTNFTEGTEMENLTSTQDLDEFFKFLDGLPEGDLSHIFDMDATEGDNGGVDNTSNGGSLGTQQNDTMMMMMHTPTNEILPTTTTTDTNDVTIDPAMFETDPELLAIDPTLLAISFPSPLNPSPSSSTSDVPVPSFTPQTGLHSQSSVLMDSHPQGTLDLSAMVPVLSPAMISLPEPASASPFMSTLSDPMLVDHPESRAGSGAPPTPTLVGSPFSLFSDHDDDNERPNEILNDNNGRKEGDGDQGPLTPLSSGWECDPGVGVRSSLDLGGSGEGVADGMEGFEGGGIQDLSQGQGHGQSQNKGKGKGRQGASSSVRMDLRRRVLTQRAWMAVPGDGDVLMGSSPNSEAVVGCQSPSRGVDGYEDVQMQVRVQKRDKGKGRARDGENANDSAMRQGMGVWDSKIQDESPQTQASVLSSFASHSERPHRPLFTGTLPYTLAHPHPHPRPHPRHNNPIRHPPPSTTTFSVSSSLSSAGAKNGKPDKASVLKRVREARRKLVEEVERTKIELWECAMEGGCLVLVGKDRELTQLRDQTGGGASGGG